MSLQHLSHRERNRRLYGECPVFARFLNTWRPSICPLTPLLHHIPEGSRVLDVGCGSGMLLLNAAIERHIRSGVGVDISPKAIANAQTALAKARDVGLETPLRFEARDPRAVLSHEECFDVVLLVDVLHHVPPAIQADFVRGVCDLVAPGGLLIYKDMCRRPMWKAWGNRLHDLVLARQWIHYFPIEDVIASSRARGLTLIHREDDTRFWYGHELAVLQR